MKRRGKLKKARMLQKERNLPPLNIKGKSKDCAEKKVAHRGGEKETLLIQG